MTMIKIRIQQSLNYIIVNDNNKNPNITGCKPVTYWGVLPRKQTWSETRD